MWGEGPLCLFFLLAITLDRENEFLIPPTAQKIVVIRGEKWRKRFSRVGLEGSRPKQPSRNNKDIQDAFYSFASILFPPSLPPSFLQVGKKTDKSINNIAVRHHAAVAMTTGRRHHEHTARVALSRPAEGEFVTAIFAVLILGWHSKFQEGKGVPRHSRKSFIHTCSYCSATMLSDI